MPQWDSWGTAYGYKKTTPIETEYDNMMEEPLPGVDNIGNFYRYIGVMVKLDD